MISNILNIFILLLLVLFYLNQMDPKLRSYPLAYFPLFLLCLFLSLCFILF